ncbi:hypothetical protein, partial [Bradyrhizobium uaiense]|uniref:hypothetical protein n=1 Tax=Bradyrhizobium uaiense TaxID=2594946 RepID=UPI0019D522B4
PKTKSQNAGKPGPTHRFPAKSNTFSRTFLLIFQVNPHSSRTTPEGGRARRRRDTVRAKRLARGRVSHVRSYLACDKFILDQISDRPGRFDAHEWESGLPASDMLSSSSKI